MDEIITKFTALLRYVPYLHEERAKVQRFLSSLPTFMKQIIKFENPKMMDKIIKKVQMCYQQTKQSDPGKSWNLKKAPRSSQNFKNFKSGPENAQRGLVNQGL